MIKYLKIINYKNKPYILFLKNRDLFICENRNIRIIHRGVLYYTVEYYNDCFWICYYDEKYSIFISKVELKIGISEKFKTNLLLSTEKYLKSLDSLNLFINNNNNDVQIVFRGWDKYSGKAYIYESSLIMNGSLNIIASSNCHSYNSSFEVCKVGNKVFILIYKNLEEGEYVLYDLFTNREVSNFNLPNISNISLVSYNKKPLIFYNKLIEKDLSISCRSIPINNGKNYLEHEYKLPLPKNIIRPQISVYMGKIYVVWNNGNNMNIALSNDLKLWKISHLNKKDTQNLVNATIIKIVDNKFEKIKTYIHGSQIYNMLKTSGSNADKQMVGVHLEKLIKIPSESNVISPRAEKLREELFQEKYINDQLENLKKIKNIETYYQSINSDYLNTINELRGIIEEKDKIIFKLLNI